ncbi:MAG TPA: phosphopantetheine-binding protein [Candidatus Hydrogenedentes bacterium]|nr:phosphopantetheine-binding protein [Candidatus Hydrogenedentota bacterium]HOS03263.1 phosphopantetheine-binding protein [Candidatus Hydrogenedentota bacterium]
MDALELEVAKGIVEALNLQQVAPEGIDPTAPLFGEGLGLDSIDALELIVMLHRNYGIKIADAEIGKAAFASVGALAAFVRERRVT